MSENGATTVRSFVVSPESSGLRLDVFLTAVCPDLSRSRIAADLSGGAAEVLVDGRPRPKNYCVRAGQTVDYRPGDRTVPQAMAQDLPLDVVHEDEHLLVINKAPGMVVHPAVGHPDGTVVNAVLHRCADLAAGDDPLRPGIVHRLDKDTSGLLVVALNDAAHRALAEQLRDRRMGRVYQAVSWGRWNPPQGTLRGDIARHPKHRQRMAVVPGGRTAVTHYEVSEAFDFVQLCRVRLETGRTHQIRVHFAHHGHPVVGDPLYGDDRRAKGVHPLDRSRAAQLMRLTERQLLHAAELEFLHPADGRRCTFQAPPPPDLAAALEILRGRSRDDATNPPGRS